MSLECMAVTYDYWFILSSFDLWKIHKERNASAWCQLFYLELNNKLFRLNLNIPFSIKLFYTWSYIFFNKVNKWIVLKPDRFLLLIWGIFRKPACVFLTSMSSSPLNKISHGYCRFQGQCHPLDEAFAPSVVHMGILGLSFLPERADPARQSRWPWLVSRARTLWHCGAGAAATGPGSLCQLVPDLTVSQARSHVCHGGRQRWHEVLIRPLAPHPSEGVRRLLPCPSHSCTLGPRCLVCHLGTPARGQTLIDPLIDTSTLFVCVCLGLLEHMLFYTARCSLAATKLVKLNLNLAVKACVTSLVHLSRDMWCTFTLR